MIKVLLRAVVAASVLAVTSVAYADCWYGGALYPEGTRIGPLTCSQGAWR